MKNLTNLADRNLALVEAAISLAHDAVAYAQPEENIEIGMGGAQFFKMEFGKMTTEEWNLVSRVFDTTAKAFAPDPEMVFDVY